MKFLFLVNFSLFDMLVSGAVIALIFSTDSYWWLLIMVPSAILSEIMERRLAIKAIMEERQRGYGP